jgi:hypothetical protein
LRRNRQPHREPLDADRRRAATRLLGAPVDDPGAQRHLIGGSAG